MECPWKKGWDLSEPQGPSCCWIFAPCPHWTLQLRGPKSFAGGISTPFHAAQAWGDAVHHSGDVRIQRTQCGAEGHWASDVAQNPHVLCCTHCRTSRLCGPSGTPRAQTPWTSRLSISWEVGGSRAAQVALRHRAQPSDSWASRAAWAAGHSPSCRSCISHLGCWEMTTQQERNGELGSNGGCV